MVSGPKKIALLTPSSGRPAVLPGSKGTISPFIKYKYNYNTLLGNIMAHKGTFKWKQDTIYWRH